MFDPSTVNKKVQYITIDSDFVSSTNTTFNGYPLGGNNNFSVNFGTSTYSVITNNLVTNATTYSSNIFIQEMRNVIGLKLVDFYVTQVSHLESNIGETSRRGTKYIDILCPDLPDQAQILDERKSKIFARVPLERDFSGTSPIIVNDKQWKSFSRQTNYFNPISIKQLNFQMWELTGQNSVSDPNGPGTYQPLQPDANFYMILEVTTIDYDAVTLPKEDGQVKVVEAIRSLEERFATLMDALPSVIKSSIPEPVVPYQATPILALEKPEPPEPEPEVKQFDIKMYIIIALIMLLAVYMFSSK
jgi:hypothetical protein